MKTVEESIRELVEATFPLSEEGSHLDGIRLGLRKELTERVGMLLGDMYHKDFIHWLHTSDQVDWTWDEKGDATYWFWSEHFNGNGGVKTIAELYVYWRENLQ